MCVCMYNRILEYLGTYNYNTNHEPPSVEESHIPIQPFRLCTKSRVYYPPAYPYIIIKSIGNIVLFVRQSNSGRNN